MCVNYQDLEFGYETVEAGDGEIGVYVSKLTGEIVCDGEPYTGEPCPVENIEGNGDYIHLPDKNTLDLGKALVMGFAERSGGIVPKIKQENGCCYFAISVLTPKTMRGRCRK